MLKITPRSIIDMPNEFFARKTTPLLDRGYLVSVFRDEKTIGILKPGSDFNHNATLLGHVGKVTALCSSPLDQRYLCSCSSDKVILWFIAEVYTADSYVIPVHSVLAEKLGYVSHCALSWDHKWLALCQTGEIFIIGLKFLVMEGGVLQLDGVTEHDSLPVSTTPCTAAAFSPQHHCTLVVLEENTFKVWNVETATLAYQSTSFGLHSLTSLAMPAASCKIVLGTNRGVVHVYHMTDHVSMWKVLTVDVNKTQQENTDTDDLTPDWSTGECGCFVFSAQLHQRESLQQEKEPPDLELFAENSTTLKSILAPGSLLIVCCNLGIILYDCKAIECVARLMFSEPVLGVSLSLVDDVVMDFQCFASIKCVVKTSLKGSRVRVMSLAVEENVTDTVCHGATVLPNVPVMKSSPLTRHMRSRVAEPASGCKRGARTGPRELCLSRSARSSGYGKPPHAHQFQPQINRSKRQAAKPVAKVSPLLNGNSDAMRCCGPPSARGQKVKLCDTSGMAIHLAASGDGNYLACSSTGSSVCVFPSADLNLERSTNLTGHDGLVNSLHFNLDSKWLVSGSNDATAKVWDWKRKKCVLNIDRRTKQASNQQNVVASEVTAARFYYMDQFVLLATSGWLELYSHLLHEDASATSAQPRYKLAHKIQLPAQKITCFSAANQLHSYVILCGCSNKSVHVFDMNASTCCAELKDVHVRAPHRVVQISGSRHTSHPAAMYDLFLTASVADCAKLWDLRATRCVQRYDRHVTRGYATGLDVSPCGRYVAVGSEDKSVCVYDTRRPEDYLGKLGGLDDVVMDVAFNPVRPTLAASALNGYVATYNDQPGNG